MRVANRGERHINAIVERYADRLRPLVARLTRGGDRRSGYVIGTTVRDLRERHASYGSHAVRLLGRAAGLSTTQLYAWEKVARDWNKASFGNLIRARRGSGKALSRSHILLLPGLRPKSTRDSLVGATLDEGLTVRQLARRARSAASAQRELAPRTQQTRPSVREFRDPSEERMAAVVRHMFFVEQMCLKDIAALLKDNGVRNVHGHALPPSRLFAIVWTVDRRLSM